MLGKYKKYIYGFIFFLWFSLLILQMLVLVNLNLSTFLIIIISLSIFFYLLSIFYGVINLSVLKNNFKIVFALFFLLILSLYCLHLYNRSLHYHKMVNQKFGQFIVVYDAENSPVELIRQLKQTLNKRDVPIEHRIKKSYLFKNMTTDLDWYTNEHDKQAERLILYEFFTYPKHETSARHAFQKTLKSYLKANQKLSSGPTLLKLAPL